MWCWGCDVRNKPNNLLAQFGLAKISNSSLILDLQNIHGDSVYKQEVSGGELTLSGAAIAWTDGNSVVALRRFEGQFLFGIFSGRDSKKKNWKAPVTEEEVRSFHVGCSVILNWIVDYETRIRGIAQIGYRDNCLDQWKKKCIVCGSDMVEKWVEIQKAVA